MGRKGGVLLGAAMVVLLVFQMLRQFLPGAVHETTGIALATCSVVHVARNRRWFAGLARGRWTARRALVAVVSCSLSAVMLGTVVCGVGMSGLAVDLGLARNTVQLRSCHLALTHLGFLLAGLHLGLHARPVAARAARAVRGRCRPGAGTAGTVMSQAGTARAGMSQAGTSQAGASQAGTLRVVHAGTVAVALVALVVAVFGAHAFAKLDFVGYISLKTRFAFIDPSQSVALFVLDHLAVLALCALTGFAADALAARVPAVKRQPNR